MLLVAAAEQHFLCAVVLVTVGWIIFEQSKGNAAFEPLLAFLAIIIELVEEWEKAHYDELKAEDEFERWREWRAFGKD